VIYYRQQISRLDGRLFAFKFFDWRIPMTNENAPAQIRGVSVGKAAGASMIVYRSETCTGRATPLRRAWGWGDWQVNAFPANALTCLG
jgi:hypothetical protein